MGLFFSMLFNSFQFVYFFIAVYALYAILNKDAQNKLLLVASYFFYGCWDWRFLILIWISSSLDFLIGRRMHVSTDRRRRQGLVALSVGVNLGILFAFKYFGFFAESFSDLLGLFGLSVSWTTLHIVLPVGISFYTFQTMSYTLDVYRGQMKPARNYLDYLLFVSFFPQLVAGPIERARHLLGQVERPRSITWEGWREGAWLILLGYYKKIVMADNLAPFANDIFNAPDEAFGLQVLVGLLAFSLQIYGDFSGYSDIARGIARLMGFDLMLNFRMPYFSTNPSDFWRRWHISLSTWLRDYLYIPLGGNRRGKAYRYRNLGITMLLGGLWHGAAWHFVAWGAYHGLLLIGYHLSAERWGSAYDRLLAKHPAGRIWRVFFFAPFILFGWLLFRVNHLADAPLLLTRIFHPFALNGKVGLLSIAIFVLPLLLVELAQERANDMLAVKKAPPWIRFACYAVLFTMILLTGSNGRTEFIYFQF